MLGENIKRYRLFKGLSLRSFGELTGLSQTAIMKYEKNELKPDGEKLIKFSEVLGCKVEDLLKDNSNKRTYNLNFRKRKSLTGHKLDLLKQIIYDKINNYLDVLELNSIEYKEIKKYKVSSLKDAETAAYKFREEHQINELIPLMIVSGILVGAIWAAVPGLLKALFNVNEVVSAIMMNWTAYWIVYYMVPKYVKGTSETESARLADSATLKADWLSNIFGGSYINYGIFLAIFSVLVIWFILNKTVLGYELKAVGFNRFGASFVSNGGNQAKEKKAKSKGKNRGRKSSYL